MPPHRAARSRGLHRAPCSRLSARPLGEERLCGVLQQRPMDHRIGEGFALCQQLPSLGIPLLGGKCRQVSGLASAITVGGKADRVGEGDGRSATAHGTGEMQRLTAEARPAIATIQGLQQGQVDVRLEPGLAKGNAHGHRHCRGLGLQGDVGVPMPLGLPGGAQRGRFRAAAGRGGSAAAWPG